MADRLPKLNKEVQRIVSEVLHAEVDVPAGVLITVTRVDITPNLRAARVWLSIFPLEQAEMMLALLDKHKYLLQGAFQNEIRMKPVPRLIFKHDTGPVYADHIERVFNELE